MRSGIEPQPLAPQADALTTMLRGGGGTLFGLMTEQERTLGQGKTPPANKILFRNIQIKVVINS